MRIALLLPVILVAGCQEQRQQLGQALSGRPPVVAGRLDGEWQIADLNGGGPVDSGRIQFEPSDQGTGRVGGTAGCNRFTGDWRQDGASLKLGPFASTMMACPPPVMLVERRVLALLEAAAGVTYTDGGEAIVATNDGRKLRLTRVPKS